MNKKIERKIQKRIPIKKNYPDQPVYIPNYTTNIFKLETKPKIYGYLFKKSFLNSIKYIPAEYKLMYDYFIDIWKTSEDFIDYFINFIFITLLMIATILTAPLSILLFAFSPIIGIFNGLLTMANRKPINSDKSIKIQSKLHYIDSIKSDEKQKKTLDGFILKIITKYTSNKNIKIESEFYSHYHKGTYLTKRPFTYGLDDPLTRNILDDPFTRNIYEQYDGLRPQSKSSVLLLLTLMSLYNTTEKRVESIINYMNQVNKDGVHTNNGKQLFQVINNEMNNLNPKKTYKSICTFWHRTNLTIPKNDIDKDIHKTPLDDLNSLIAAYSMNSE